MLTVRVGLLSFVARYEPFRLHLDNGRGDSRVIPEMRRKLALAMLTASIDRDQHEV